MSEAHVKLQSCPRRLGNEQTGDLVWDDYYNEWVCFQCSYRPAVDQPHRENGHLLDDTGTVELVASILRSIVRDIKSDDPVVRLDAEAAMKGDLVRHVLDIVCDTGLSELEVWKHIVKERDLGNS